MNNLKDVYRPTSTGQNSMMWLIGDFDDVASDWPTTVMGKDP